MVTAAAVILAAGQSTRMITELPKVLHEVCGRPMLAYVIDACRAAGVGQLYISQVVHRTVLDVYEQGTEAAAMTAVVEAPGAPSSPPPPQRFTMIVDHPFFFAIEDRQSEALLLMGSITDPQ